MNDDTNRDTALAQARDTHMPAIKALGAVSQTMVEISDTESVLISEWPDLATRQAAMDKIESIRSQVTEAALTQMTGEMKGDVAFRL
ncbi:MAG: hypothetical protein ACI8R4_003773 [Paracoccaceae bacterium]|jgi:hypothetical protein